MATKTIINCMDQTTTTMVPPLPHQGISIIIDQGNNSISDVQTQAATPTSSATVSNVIKIQHSCQAAPQTLTTLTSIGTNSNKLLIDINRKQTIDDHQREDHRGLEASLPTAIVKVKCATSTEYSREMMKANEKPMAVASVRLETANGAQQTGRDPRERKDGGDDDHHHDDRDEQNNDDGQEKEKSLAANNKELTKYFNESGQTAKIHSNSTTTITTTTITAAATTTTITTSQQVNGNSKCRENNGHFSTNQPNIIEATRPNGQENDERHDHHHDLNDHDGDHHDHRDDGDDDHAKFVGMGKRDSCLDFSHGKRWPGQENSSSLLTKADTATTQLHTPASSLTINESGNRKENSPFQPPQQQQLNENSQTAAHVVKIQINPKTNTSSTSCSLEKQISIVKIESNQNLILNKNQPKKETKNKDNQVEEEEEKVVEKEENLRESENSSESKEGILKKSELHLNLERMVQRSHHNTVTVTGGTTPSSATATTTTTTTNPSATNGSTGATTVTELNVTNPNYLYYTMSSGQFSPCDTLDSGTGSDLETQQHSTQSSPSAHLLLTKKSSSNSSMNGLEMHLKTTKIRVSSSNGKEQRNCSFTDSEESEASSLSCDSLHSSEYMRQSSTSPVQTKTPSPSSKILGSYLPDSLLRDIKNLKLTNTEYEAENENEEEDDPKQRVKTHKRNETYEPISSQDYMVAQNDYVHTRNSLNVVHSSKSNNNNNSSSSNMNGSSSNPQHLSTSLKRASLPSKTFVLNQEDGTFIDMKMNSMPRKYEADKYYNFHVNEHENFRSFGNNSGSNMGGFGDGSGSDTMSLSEYDTRSINDDVFAGYRDIRCGSATSTIRSSKGTVRGVKNRVRNGIATFLQMQQPNMKNFKEKDSGKVVLYTTSMGIIRDTYAKCSNVKQILRTLLVKFEERDVFMSVEYQQEIKERMHSEIIKVPQLFVEGQHIGDADTVERLNESGELRQLLKSYKSIATTFTCQTCGGYRLLPCPSCKGSKKSVHRNHFTAEFVALKCMNCDEVGLVKCHNC